MSFEFVIYTSLKLMLHMLLESSFKIKMENTLNVDCKCIEIYKFQGVFERQI